VRERARGRGSRRGGGYLGERESGQTTCIDMQKEGNLSGITRTFTDLFVLSASANSAVSASPILHQNVCMKGGKVRRDR